MAADRMGVVEDDLAVRRFQAVELGGQRVVVGAVIVIEPLRDRRFIGLAKAIERFALEGRRRAQLGRRLPWIERRARRSEEHTSELQSLMRISYAVFCLKKKNNNKTR